MLQAQNPDISVLVADARFMKPLDAELLRSLALQSDVLVTIEEVRATWHASSVCTAYAPIHLYPPKL